MADIKYTDLIKRAGKDDAARAIGKFFGIYSDPDDIWRAAKAREAAKKLSTDYDFNTAPIKSGLKQTVKKPKLSLGTKNDGFYDSIINAQKVTPEEQKYVDGLIAKKKRLQDALDKVDDSDILTGVSKSKAALGDSYFPMLHGGNADTVAKMKEYKKRDIAYKLKAIDRDLVRSDKVAPDAYKRYNRKAFYDTLREQGTDAKHTDEVVNRLASLRKSRKGKVSEAITDKALDIVTKALYGTSAVGTVYAAKKLNDSLDESSKQRKAEKELKEQQKQEEIRKAQEKAFAEEIASGKHDSPGDMWVEDDYVDPEALRRGDYDTPGDKPIGYYESGRGKPTYGSVLETLTQKPDTVLEKMDVEPDKSTPDLPKSTKADYNKALEAYKEKHKDDGKMSPSTHQFDGKLWFSDEEKAYKDKSAEDIDARIKELNNIEQQAKVQGNKEVETNARASASALEMMRDEKYPKKVQSTPKGPTVPKTDKPGVQAADVLLAAGVGGVTGAAAYGMAGFVPQIHKRKLLRALIGLAFGAGAGLGTYHLITKDS